VPAAVVQQHQREQAEHFGLVREQVREHSCQANRLAREIMPRQVVTGGRRVTLVEHEVDHREHRRESLGDRGGRGDFVGNAGVSNLAFGPDEALRHRRLGRQEGAGDLVGRQPAQGAQRQGHLGVLGQCRVTAREHQPQPLVGQLGVLGELVERGFGLGERLELVAPLGPSSLATDAIERPVAGDRRQPRAGTIGNPVSRPPIQCGRQRVMQHVLGELEVAEDSDQCGKDTRRLVAKHVRDCAANRLRGRHDGSVSSAQEAPS